MLFASSAPPDGKWVNLYELARRMVPAFVLLHPAGAAPFDTREVLLLGKPVQPRELHALLEAVAGRASAVKPG